LRHKKDLKIAADWPLQTLHILGEASTKSKPSERVGRKATDLLDNARKSIVQRANRERSRDAKPWVRLAFGG